MSKLEVERRQILEDNNWRPLQEVANILGVTKQRVDQLYQKYEIDRHPLKPIVRRFIGEEDFVRAKLSTSATDTEAMRLLKISSKGALYELCNHFGIRSPKQRNDAKTAEGLKRCSVCHLWKNRDEEFWNDVSRKDGKQYICKDCFKPIAAENQRKWVKKKKEERGFKV